MPNFIKYSQMVAEITHLGFLNGEHSPFWIYLRYKFLMTGAVETHSVSLCQILWSSVKPLLRYLRFSRFLRLGFRKLKILMLWSGLLRQWASPYQILSKKQLNCQQHKAAGRKTRLDIQNYGCDGNLLCYHGVVELLNCWGDIVI